jgi:hypothetical protein
MEAVEEKEEERGAYDRDSISVLHIVDFVL